MNSILEILSKITKPVGETSETDYEQDGLLYCGKCNTPKQCFVNLAGHREKVTCLCRCAKEEKAGARKEYRKLKEEETRQAQRKVSIQDTTLRTATFENDSYPDSKIMKYARRYVECWEDFYNKGIGLFLFGDVGGGKTYAAACIANALIDRGVSVLMSNFSKIIKGMPGMFDGDQNAYLRDINRNSLLIIDDLGVERGTEYVTEQVYTIIDERYKSGKPVIITSNIPWHNILSEQETKYQRIYDRIVAMCQPVLVESESKRKNINSERRQEMTELFRGCV